jgi:hypothetical protein
MVGPRSLAKGGQWQDYVVGEMMAKHSIGLLSVAMETQSRQVCRVAESECHVENLVPEVTSEFPCVRSHLRLCMTQFPHLYIWAVLALCRPGWSSSP